MAQLFMSALEFGIAVQLTAYIIWSFNLLHGLIVYPLGSAADINNLNNLFSLNLWSGLIGGAGIVISIVMLLMRQGTYALYAMLIMAISIFFNIVKGFVLAIPNLVSAIVPSSYAGPIQIVIGIITLFGGFLYIFGLVIQRNPTQ